MAKHLSESHIKFNEKTAPLSTMHKTSYTPFEKEEINNASVLGDINYIESNKPRLFQERYSTIDYLEDEKRYQSKLASLPKDQFMMNTVHNKGMKADEMTSHALKTPQPPTKQQKKLKKFSRRSINGRNISQPNELDGAEFL